MGETLWGASRGLSWYQCSIGICQGPPGSCSPFETSKYMPLFFFLLVSSYHHPSMNLYIVGCVQCIWDITGYFLLNTTIKINRLLLHFWLLEITQGRIRFWNYLFQADKRISRIQNLSGGYNLNLYNIFV